ncbi:hypothetical protein LEMLEM_LOCUS24045 [Lemmus lemmus]
MLPECNFTSECGVSSACVCLPIVLPSSALVPARISLGCPWRCCCQRAACAAANSPDGGPGSASCPQARARPGRSALKTSLSVGLGQWRDRSPPRSFSLPATFHGLATGCPRAANLFASVSCEYFVLHIHTFDICCT